MCAADVLCYRFSAEFGNLFKHERIPFDERRRNSFYERPIFAEYLFRLFIAPGEHSAALGNDFIIVQFRSHIEMIVRVKQCEAARSVIGDEPLHNRGCAVDIRPRSHVEAAVFEFNGGFARKQGNDALVHTVVRPKIVFALENLRYAARIAFARPHGDKPDALGIERESRPAS